MATTDRLYNLLPAIYREHDALEGYPLQALLGIIEQQVGLLQTDIEGLWNNLFIETCQPWVIPYIGDLVSNDLLYDGSRDSSTDTASDRFTDLASSNLRPPVAARARADVAKTIYYRRCKGTLPMLEELARDVTGWPAKAVEFFRLLGWTQHPNHVRPEAAWTDVRSVERMDRVGGPFDETMHTVDVRRISQQEGWHNIHNLGFFFWRLGSYPLESVPARQGSQPGQYHFSPLGNPMPLFARWRREGDDSGLATELHVAGPIRAAFFSQDLAQYAAQEPTRADYSDLYGNFDTAPDTSLFIARNGVAVPLSADPSATSDAYEPRVVCRRLDPWPASRPTGQVIAVDVERGRLAVGDAWPDPTESIDVSFHYGFAADLGGGPYDRSKWLIREELADEVYRVKEDGVVPDGTPEVTHTSVTDALAAWEAADRPNTIISILDSRTYSLPSSIDLSNEGWLAIEAADGERPLLQPTGGVFQVGVLAPEELGDSDRDAALTLSGVVLEGGVRVTGDLGKLRVLHATLVPGRSLTEAGDPSGTEPSLEVDGGSTEDPINAQLQVEMAFSISGPMHVPEHAAGVWLLDSILDGLGGAAIEGPGGTEAGPLSIERSTVLGSTGVRSLDASESIFAGTIQATRTQDGCVRFSYVAPGSRTPRRYRCQPDVAVDEAIADARDRYPSITQAEIDAVRARVEDSLAPSFAARRYGQPAYAQLHLHCPTDISTGAEDGSEMGAFSHRKQAQRESNLRIRLREYLPFGLEAGAIYVT